MERYDDLDLDLECDGGGVAQKAALFGGMFKKSTKSVDLQDNLSVNGDLSKSNDSLADGNSKDKGGGLKGMFKKTTKSSKETQAQTTMSSKEPELFASSDSTSENKPPKDKSGVLGGILKLPHKPGHVRRPSQDLLESDISGSNGSLSENANTKESSGMFGGIFKKATKPYGARTQSQEDLTEPSELSRSNDSLSATGNTKESGGMFKVFKKHKRTESQDDLSAPDDLSRSNDSLDENTKEKGGFLSGMFKKKGAKSQSVDDLSVDDELSSSSENLTEKSSKGGGAAKILKNPFSSSSQEKDKEKERGENAQHTGETEKPKNKQNGFSAMMKSTFYTDKQEKKVDTDDEALMDSGDELPTQKQKDTEETETLKEKENLMEEKPKPVKHDMFQQEKSEQKEKSKIPLMPPRPSVEERKRTFENDSKDKNDTTPRLKSEKPANTPVVPPRRPVEEMDRAEKHDQQRQKNVLQSQSDVERLKQGESVQRKEADEVNTTESKAVGKHKHHNPFKPSAASKAASDDEVLNEDNGSVSQEEKQDEEEKEKKVTKVKKKRHNPFMPQVKAKVKQKADAEDAGEIDRTLFDRLEDLREVPSQPETNQDVEDLMDWWNTVEQWEDTPCEDDMTEKEEAKAFALTAEKVQKGIRVFNKLFSERAESLWQHVIDLNAIADGLDKFNKKTKIAQITGGSTSAIGGVATIAGLALAPITFGTSLIVTAVGLGVATAGGLTSAGAGISNQVNNSMDRKKVEKIVEDYQEKMVDLNKCLKFIKQGIENLRKFDLIRMKNHAYNNDFPVLSSRFYEDGAMAGKAILINANEIMRVVQIANVAGSTAARAVQIASMATGILTGLFVGMDIYFVAKDSKELKKGAKSEFAAKIRDVSTQLHDGLVELNSLREELQSTTPQDNADKESSFEGSYNKEKDSKYDSSEEDEIDRIKKAIKKDIENREYV